MLLATAAHIEARVTALGSSLTGQFCELETKIDEFGGQLDAVAQVVYDIVIAAIQTIIEITFASTRSDKVKQQVRSITEKHENKA